VAQRYREFVLQSYASLTRHLSANIFASDVLIDQQTELIKVSASLDRVEGVLNKNIMWHPRVQCHNFFYIYNK